MPRNEYQQKMNRIRNYLNQHNLQGVLLGKQHNFAWATCGKTNRVLQGSEKGHSSLLISPDNSYLLASNIELPRLTAEEIDELPVKTVGYQWNKENLPKTIEDLGINPRAVQTDTPSLGFKQLPTNFSHLRYAFTEPELDRYYSLGQDATRVVENYCRQHIEPGQTELEIAGGLSSRLLGEDIIPTVLLIGSDRRAFNYRHPIPKNKQLENYVMVVVCGKRNGQIINLTRCVHFGPVSNQLSDRFQSCCQVDATFISATRAGRTPATVLGKGIQAYHNQGYSDEWKQHHQGGATGYREREYLATNETTGPIVPKQPMAWNPSIQGAKCEDTIIAHENNYSFVTEPGEAWPTIEVHRGNKDISRPNLLKR